MMKQLTRIMGLLLIPAATALAVTSEPPSSALPSATDFSGVMLAERADIVSWKTLGQVTPINENGKIIPQFAESVLALNKQDVKVQGFMVPIEPDPTQKHFVLSAVPAGPESMVEVRLKSGIDYNINPIVVSGRLTVSRDDPRGVFYTLTEGVPINGPAP